MMQLGPQMDDSEGTCYCAALVQAARAGDAQSRIPRILEAVPNGVHVR